MYSAQVVETPEEGNEEVHVLEASEDELEAEHRETVALMTIEKQRRGGPSETVLSKTSVT